MTALKPPDRLARNMDAAVPVPSLCQRVHSHLHLLVRQRGKIMPNEFAVMMVLGQVKLVPNSNKMETPYEAT